MRILRGIGEFLMAVFWWLVGIGLFVGFTLLALLIGLGASLVIGDALAGFLTVVILIAGFWWLAKRSYL
jgi:hypothetical protein